jgi:hypothetical protein
MKKIIVILFFIFSLNSVNGEVTIKEDTISFTAYDYEECLYPSTPYEPSYPYERLNYKSINWGKKITKTFKLLILENEFLKLTILPEIGGRIYEAIYKPTGINMFFKNDVIKPAILYGGGTGYMFVIGGLKYGFPTCAHSPNNLTPWKYKIIKNKDKSISVLTYDTDLETDMRIYVKVTLHPQTSLIDLNTKLENPTIHKRKYYYWICAALEPNDNVEFIFPTDRMILHGAEWGPSARTVISWPIFNGVDYSKFKNWGPQQGLFPWKNKNKFVGSYDHGKNQGIVRIYPSDKVPGTKLWCFARNYHSNNYTDNYTIYYEIFGGNTETQDDYTFMDPNSSLEWTEYWYPIKDTNGFVYANKDLALNIKKSENSGINLWLASTKIFARLKLIIYKDDNEIHNQDISITPDKPIKLSISPAISFSNDSKIKIICLIDKNKQVLEFETTWGKLGND